jgi:hypothetical protein
MRYEASVLARCYPPCYPRLSEGADLQGCLNPVWAFSARLDRRERLETEGHACREGCARANGDTPVIPRYRRRSRLRGHSSRPLAGTASYSAGNPGGGLLETNLSAE